MLAWLLILPWQPFFAIWPCRRVGDTQNWKLLQVPEFLAILYACGHVHYYLANIWLAKDNHQPALFVRQPVANSHYQGPFHTETCSWVGRHGHLHWTVATADTWFTPNAFSYGLLWSSIIFARPWQFASGILMTGLVIFLAEIIYFGGSFEAGSVWCWSSVIMQTYFLVQPYILPCADDDNDDNGNDEKKDEAEEAKVLEQEEEEEAESSVFLRGVEYTILRHPGTKNEQNG